MASARPGGTTITGASADSDPPGPDVPDTASTRSPSASNSGPARVVASGGLRTPTWSPTWKNPAARPEATVTGTAICPGDSPAATGLAGRFSGAVVVPPAGARVL